MLEIKRAALMRLTIMPLSRGEEEENVEKDLEEEEAKGMLVMMIIY